MTHAFSIISALLLCASVVYSAQVVPGVQMATTSSLTLPTSTAKFKQTVLTWDNPLGASNRVAWGGARYSWTNSTAVSTNRFNVTNGVCYCVTAIVNGIESIPALWPSNRFDRVIVQTSTNLSIWADAFAWTTNYNKPQEYLRLRSELIRWE
jgi:hypothetical protein